MTLLRKLDSNDRTIKLSDGRLLGYREYGAPTGKPLLFFHGWPSSRFHGSTVDEVAKEQNIRVISLDRPGHGLSDYQNHRTLLDWPNDVLELVHQLRIKRFSILGVSGGGPYVAVCAYKIPEQIEKAGIVVGLAPTYVPGNLNGMKLYNKLAWSSYSKHIVFAYLACYLHYYSARFFPRLLSIGYMTSQDKQIIYALKNTYPSEALEPFRKEIRGTIQDLEIYSHDWGFKIEDIKKEIFLWYGENDKNVPKVMGEYYAKHLPKNKVMFYKNEGHLIIRRHATEILTTLFT